MPVPIFMRGGRLATSTSTQVCLVERIESPLHVKGEGRARASRPPFTALLPCRSASPTTSESRSQPRNTGNIQRALSENSLIGREALSHSEISDRIEVLKQFEFVGIMSAGEIEWLHARLNGSSEPFEKWAWRELQESVFETSFRKTEFEALPFWKAYTEATKQLWWNEAFADSSLGCYFILILLPRIAEVPSCETVVLACRILRDLQYLLQEACHRGPTMNHPGELDVGEIVIEPVGIRWRLEIHSDCGHCATVFFEGPAVVDGPPYEKGYPPPGWV